MALTPQDLQTYEELKALVQEMDQADNLSKAPAAVAQQPRSTS